jgi:hypothetical protein
VQVRGPDRSKRPVGRRGKRKSVLGTGRSLGAEKGENRRCDDPSKSLSEFRIVAYILPLFCSFIESILQLSALLPGHRFNMSSRFL